MCYAARKLGRPVSWRGDRSEEFLAAHMARDQHSARRSRSTAKDASSRSHRGARQHRRGAGRLFGHHPAATHAEGATTVYRVPVVDYRLDRPRRGKLLVGGQDLLHDQEAVRAHEAARRSR